MSLQEKRRLKRRHEILDAALAKFDEQGYHGASVEEIAAAALLTRAGLYRHYPDKPSLLRALVRWKMEELTDATAEALERAGAPARDDGAAFERRVRAAVGATLAFQSANPGFFRVLMTAGALGDERAAPRPGAPPDAAASDDRSAAASDDPDAAASDDPFTPYAALLTGLVADGRAAGRVALPQADDEIAMMLVSLMFKNPVKRDVLGYEPPTSPAADAELMTRIFVDGVRGAA